MTEQQPQIPNVDAGEIAKFNALAERWWDLNSEFRPLHDINPLRQMRTDINRLNLIQSALAPRKAGATGRVTCNEQDAKTWAALQRLKMDLMQQYGVRDRQTPRDMPTLGDT